MLEGANQSLLAGDRLNYRLQLQENKVPVGAERCVGQPS